MEFAVVLGVAEQFVKHFVVAEHLVEQFAVVLVVVLVELVELVEHLACEEWGILEGLALVMAVN